MLILKSHLYHVYTALACYFTLDLSRHVVLYYSGSDQASKVLSMLLNIPFYEDTSNHGTITPHAPYKAQEDL